MKSFRIEVAVMANGWTISPPTSHCTSVAVTEIEVYTDWDAFVKGLKEALEEPPKTKDKPQ